MTHDANATDSEWILPKEALKLLPDKTMGRTSFYNALRDRRIAHARFSRGRIRVRKSDVLDFIVKCQIPARPDFKMAAAGDDRE